MPWWLTLWIISDPRPPPQPDGAGLVEARSSWRVGTPLTRGNGSMIIPKPGFFVRTPVHGGHPNCRSAGRVRHTMARWLVDRGCAAVRLRLAVAACAAASTGQA